MLGAQLRGGVLADNPGDGDPGVADPGVRDPGDGRPVSYCLYLLLFERCQAISQPAIFFSYLVHSTLFRISLLNYYFFEGVSGQVDLKNYIFCISFS